MSDLISRSTLTEKLEKMAEHLSPDSAVDTVIFSTLCWVAEAIQEQDTAYDPDKVVERLKEFEGVWEPQLSEVIEIVKRGGTDET